MSLLMDALKKAEREREAQASKEQGEAGDSSQELTLDPMDFSEREEPELPTVKQSDEDSWDALGDEIDARDFDLDLDEVDLDFDAPDFDKAAAPEVLRDVPLVSPSEDDGIPLDDTSATMPSMKAVKASVDRYFDGSTSASISMQMPATEQDDSTTVVRTKDAAVAQAAAQTVFQAKRRRRAVGWVWIPIGLVAFVLLIGGGIFYYFTLSGTGSGGFDNLIAAITGRATTPPATSGVSTQTSSVDNGATTQTAAAGADTSTTQADDASMAAGAQADAEVSPEPQDGLLAGFEEPALSDVLDVEPPPVGDLTPVEPESAEQVQPTEIVDELAFEPTSEELLASADQQIAAALAEEPASSTPAIRQDSFELTRQYAAPKVNPKVMSAYEAFQRNDFATAELDYRLALQREPNNRDALLGLAAIAVKKNHSGLATQIYSEVLRVDPRDTIAQAALLALNSNPTTANESQLKLMLEREPDSSHLHFSLGNYYASQSLWPEAQNAYFNAFRLDNGNPDYAYNLAIGLDHLAQRQAAVKYYQLALNLAAGQPTGFEPAVVRRRIESISQ